MKHIAVLLCLWILLPAFSGNTLSAQAFKNQAAAILRSDWSPQRKADSLYRLSLRHYQQDYVYFTGLSDTLLHLSAQAAYLPGKAQSQILLSLISDRQGNLEAMRQHARKALEYLSGQPAGSELSWALYCEGNYFRRKKRDKEAMEAFFKGLKVAEATGDKHEQASFNTLLGIMHVGREEYDKALAYYDKALRLARAVNDQVRIQRTYTNKGIVYMRQGKYNEALQSHQQALKMAKELHDESDEAFAYNDLGATYLQINEDLPKAIEYLQQAAAIRERLDQKDEIAYTYGYLGQAYGKAGNRKEAIRWIEKALQTAIAIGNHKQQYEALEELAAQYSRFRQYDSAYHYLRAYTVFRDSVRKAQQTEAIDELTVRYETEKKEQEIILLTQENRIQQLGISQRNLYLCMAALLVAGAMVTLRQLYRSKKVKEEKLRKEAAIQAELLQLEAENTLQNDRLRISKELHDNIGANLTFIQSSIEASAPVNTEWQDVKSLVNDTITDLRRTVWLINKPSVRLDEWLVKLREYYRKIRKVAIETDVADESLVLSSRQATLVFRIIQEAVHNSLKHSGASGIHVTVSSDAVHMEAVVEDDGKGFEAPVIPQGFGLEHMRQHARELEGTLDIESPLHTGTKIRLRFRVL